MPVDTDHPPTKNTCRVCGHYEYRHGVHRMVLDTRPRRAYDPEAGTHFRAALPHPQRGSYDALQYGYALADEGVCATYQPR